jgi:acyl-coenzyme A synthetase/AMP-(fatty) acid ligase
MIGSMFAHAADRMKLENLLPEQAPSLDLEHYPSIPARFTDVRDLAYINFSSGTTGKCPKIMDFIQHPTRNTLKKSLDAND